MSWYSTDVNQQPCALTLRATKEDCARCLFTERCLADTLELEELMGEPRSGIFGGLTQSERAQLVS
jgi:hypothetical protein